MAPIQRAPTWRAHGVRLATVMACLIACQPSLRAHAREAGPSMQLEVDLTDAPSRLLRVRESIAATPGRMTLHYPQWIPGEHGPSGPIANVAGLQIAGGGKRVAWRRDLRDPYTLHLQVPDDVRTLQLSFQFLSPLSSGRFGAGPSTSNDLAMLEFNQVLFYPHGSSVDSMTVRPTVILPAQWQFASSLEVATRHRDSVEFEPVTLRRLIDAPLMIGRHMARIDLGRLGQAPVRLNVAGDRGATIMPDATQQARLKALSTQIHALFGPPPFGHYDFLLMLSDHIGHFGLEHLQSSDDRLPADFLANPDMNRVLASLLPHEWVHAWNGKYRRPADLWPDDYNTPQQTDLLWVYEGLTDYWASVLSARAGLWSPDYFRASLAATRDLMAHRSGRQWRSLQDVSDAGRLTWEGAHGWYNWRRGTDFYPEGQLLWLDVDTLIRQLSHGRRSLDDFARSFFAGQGMQRAARAYTFDDIVAALDRVQHHDWRAFLRQRLDYTGDGLPYQGLERAGWTVAYQDTPGARTRDIRQFGHGLQMAASIGMMVSEDGKIGDVQWQGPASSAGLVPGMQIIAVNGHAFSLDALTRAVRASAGSDSRMRLLARNLDVYRTFDVDYHGGLRYPHLQRIKNRPDMLGDIIAPRP